MKKLYIFLFLFSIAACSFAQVYEMDVVNGTTVTTCKGQFTSSNPNTTTFGSGSNGYANNENYTVTFCSSSGPIRVNFYWMDIETNYDFLKIYDGPTTGSTLLATLTGSGYYPGVYTSSGTCLTFKFTSDGVGRWGGWDALIGCTPTACGSNAIATDDCSSAPTICNLNGYCGNTSGWFTRDNGGIEGSSYGGSNVFSCGSIQNNSWLSFIADATTASFSITSSLCSASGGIQAIVLSSPNCSSFSSVSNCVSQGAMGTSTLNATGLTIGTRYYIMVDGLDGNDCRYDVVALSGVQTVNVTPDKTSACPGQNVTFTAGVTGTGPFTYSWSPAPTSGQGTNTAVYTVSTTTVYSVTIGGACGSSQTATYTFTPTNPTVSVASNTTICSGNSTTLIASGSASSSTVSFSNTSDFSIPDNNSTGVTSPINVFGLSGTVGTSLVSVNLNITHTYDQDLTIYLKCPNGVQITLSAQNGAGGDNYTSTTFSTTGTAITSGSAPFTGTYTPEQAFSLLSSCNLNGTWSLVVVDGAGSDIGTLLDWTINFNNTLTYSWSPSAGLSATSGSSVTASPTVTTTYTVTGTDNGGCSNTATVTVTVNPSPTVTVNSATYCAGGSASLSASGATSYSWSPATGLSGTTGANVTASPTVTTTYTVTGTSATCSSPASSTVTVNPKPTVTSTSVSVCNGASATITASGADTYSWNTGVATAGLTINPATATTTYTVTGTNTVTTCTNTVTGVITVNAKPTVTSTSVTVCNGASATITASGANTYSWNTGAATAGLTINPATTTTTYTVTGTNTLTTCTNTATGVITVNAKPTVTSTSVTVCNGASATITASGANTYLWNTGTATAGLTINPATTTTTYTVTGTNTVTSCTNTATGVITVNAKPTVTSTSVTVCNGVSATITASGADTYLWNTGTATAGLTINPATTTTTYTVTGTNTVTTCTNTATGVITVNAKPTVTSTSVTVCNGASATITASGANTYLWNTGTATAGLTINPATTTTTYTVTGTNTVTTCTNTATGVITVNAKPTVTSTSVTVCNGASATITASGADTYSWNTGAATAGLTINPATATTTYTVTGTSTVTTCTSTATGIITVNPKPTVTSSSVSVCNGASATITASGADTYSWNTGVATAGLTINPATTTTTYTVTGTSTVTTCTNTATGIITVNAKPTVTSTSVTVCNGASATITASGANTYSWNTGAATAGLTISPATTTTTYTVTGTNTVTSCTNTATGVITVNAKPTVTSTSVTVCNGASATITASGADTYLWNTGTATAGLTINPATTTTTYTVTGTNTVTTCTNTATGVITVNAKPTVTSTSVTVCNGASATITASGADTYSWNTGVATAGLTINPATTTTTYTVTGTNTVTSCTNTATGVITVNAKPTVTSTSVTLCNGASATITASGADTYLWNTGTATAGLTINPVTTTTTYTVTGTNTVTTCTNTATGVITVNAKPTVTSTSVTVCNGASATITASGANTYSWNTGVATAGLTINPATTTTTYTVTGTNTVTTCTNTATGVITVNAKPTVTSTSVTVCNGASATITASGADTYSWNTGAATAGLTINPATATTTYTVTGTSTVTTCTSTATGIITVNPKPTVTSSSSSQTVCSGTTVNSISFSTTPATGVTISWSNSNTAIGLSASGMGSTINGYTAPNVASVTTGIISAVVTNTATACSSSSTPTGTITINPLPVITSTATVTNPTTCGGINGSLTGFAASGAVSYSWNGGAPNASSTLSGIGSGSYTVVATNGQGCTISAAYSLVDPTSPSPPAFTLNNSTICAGGSAILSVTTPVAGQTYNWTGPNGSLGTGNSVTINPATLSDAGSYNVYTTAAGCTGSVNPAAATTLTVNANPTAVISSNATSFCMQSNLVLGSTGSNPGGTATIPAGGYQWIFNGTPISGATSSTYTATVPGNYSLQLTNNFNCTNTSASYPVALYSEPDMSGSTPVSVNSNCSSSTGSISGVAVSNGTANYTYSWYGSSGLINSSTIASANAPALTNQAAGTYTLIVVDNNGCNDTLTAIIVNDNAPAAPIVASNNPNCSGSPNNPVNLTAGSGTITWYSDAGLTNVVGTGNPYTPSALATTTLYVTETSNGCQSPSSQVVVTVNPKPSAPMVNNANYCQGQTISDLTATSGGGTINWYSDAGLTNVIGTGSPWASGITTTTTVYVAETSLGCLGTSVPVTITVNSLPVIDVTSMVVDSSSCSLTANDGGLSGIAVTGNPNFTYVWNNASGVVSTSTTTSDLVNQSMGSYTLSVTDVNGCVTSQGPLNIVSSSPSQTPDLLTSSDTVYCNGEAMSALSVTGSNIQWYSDAGLTNLLGVGNTLTPTGITSSTTLYVISNNNNCYSIARPVSITFNPLPTVSGNNPVVCQGGQATLNGTGAQTYAWDNGVIDGTPFTPSATATYIVTGTDVNGCVNTGAVTLTVNSLPTVGTNVGSATSVCSGGSITLSGTGAQTYSWNNGITDGIAFTPTGTVNYIVTGTDANGCVNTATTSVTVNPLPTVTINGNPSSVCAGSSITLSGAGAQIYTWDNGITDGVSFIPAGSGPYMVTGTDTNGCVNTSTIIVFVNQLPNVSANSPAVCIGTSTILSGTGAQSYTWDNGVVDGASFTPAATGPYVVTGTDANGCVNTSTVIVTVNPLPTVGTNVGAGTSVCSGGSVTLNGTGAQTYSWDNGITDGVAFTPTVAANYVVTGTDANGCVNTATTSVSFNAPPAITVNASASSICAGNPVTLSGSGAQSYSWDNGVTDGVPFIPAGSGPFVVTGTDVNGCVGTATITIIVNQLPGVSANSPSVCIGSSTILSGTGAQSYAWNNGVVDGSPFTPSATAPYVVTGTDANGCVNTSTVTVTVNQLPNVSANSPTVCTGSTATLSGTGAQSYTWNNGVTDGVPFTPSPIPYVVTGTDANGCVNTATVSVTLKPLPVVGAVQGSSTAVCLGSSLTLNGTGALSYTWDNGITDGVPFSVSLPGNYVVTGTDANGCINTFTVAVAINSLPDVDAGTDNTLPCGVGSTLNLNGSSFTANATFLWTGPASFTSTAANASVNAPGQYTLTVTDPSSGCTDTSSVNITQIAVNAAFTASSTTGFAPITVSFSNQSTGATSYLWSFGNGVTSAAINPSHLFTSGGTYQVILTATSGTCSDTASITILLQDSASILIPNVFTPNGDGTNDLFFITTTGIEELHGDIFNRWGERIISIEGANASWDGKTVTGENASSGTYYLLLRAKGFDGTVFERQAYIGLFR